MLAFVFWHWPRAGVEREEYVAKLAAFHETLRHNPPAGFRFSAVFRGGPAPWLAAPADSYEDWYVTDGSAALDPLNLGAVGPACRESHDACARLADGGAAGLYRLRNGDDGLPRGRVATWFAKPAGMTYAELDRAIAPLLDTPHAGWWGRQMVLGPTPEFCLLTAGPVELPAGFSGLARPLDPVWRNTQ